MLFCLNCKTGTLSYIQKRPALRYPSRPDATLYYVKAAGPAIKIQFSFLEIRPLSRGSCAELCIPTVENLRFSAAHQMKILIQLGRSYSWRAVEARSDRSSWKGLMVFQYNTQWFYEEFF